MDRDAIAHAKKKEDGQWAPPHLLEEHVYGVAAMAEVFAAAFGNGDWVVSQGVV